MGKRCPKKHNQNSLIRFSLTLWFLRGAQDPIPSRTRPSNSSAPMVLSLKAWESRSLQGLPKTYDLVTMSKENFQKPLTGNGEGFLRLACSHFAWFNVPAAAEDPVLTAGSAWILPFRASDEGHRTKGIGRRASDEGHRTKGIGRRASDEGHRVRQSAGLPLLYCTAVHSPSVRYPVR
jgi:hypothetical protein